MIEWKRKIGKVGEKGKDNWEIELVVGVRIVGFLVNSDCSQLTYSCSCVSIPNANGLSNQSLFRLLESRETCPMKFRFQFIPERVACARSLIAHHAAGYTYVWFHTFYQFLNRTSNIKKRRHSNIKSTSIQLFAASCCVFI